MVEREMVERERERDRDRDGRERRATAGWRASCVRGKNAQADGDSTRVRNGREIYATPQPSNSGKFPPPLFPHLQRLVPVREGSASGSESQAKKALGGCRREAKQHRGKGKVLNLAP